MGGKGSGGKRPGCGRKRKSELEEFITGYSGHRAKVTMHPSASTGPIEYETFDVPATLTHRSRWHWRRLAPFAFANGTLTRATSYAFELLCCNVALLEAEAKGKAPGGAAYRGLVQRVETELLRFNLTPNGKPMYEGRTATMPQALPGPPVNPLTKFLRR